MSEQPRHEALMNPSQFSMMALPPDPGTLARKDDEARLYHYTSDEALPSILSNGLKRSEAKGDTYGEPNMVWASGQMPTTQRAFVEFHAPMEQLDIGSNSDPDLITARGSNVTMRGDVSPSQIKTANEPWHHTAKYIRDDPSMQAGVLAGEYDDIGDPDADRAVEWAKRTYGK